MSSGTTPGTAGPGGGPAPVVRRFGNAGDAAAADELVAEDVVDHPLLDHRITDSWYHEATLELLPQPGVLPPTEELLRMRPTT